MPPPHLDDQLPLPAERFVVDETPAEPLDSGIPVAEVEDGFNFEEVQDEAYTEETQVLKQEHEKPHDDHLKDHFYRLNFFSMLKWVFVLCAAVIGIRTSRKAVFKNRRKNFKPLRKARCLILLASIAGLCEMWQAKKFHHDMVKTWDKQGNKPMEVSSSFETEQQTQMTEDDGVVYLNEQSDDFKGRGLHGGHHGGHHGGKHHGGHHEEGPHHGGMGCFMAIVPVFLWFALVGPFLCIFRRFTWLKHKIHKINEKCTEAQRLEVSRRVVENMKCYRKCREPQTAESQLKKLYAQANKMTAKLQRITEQTQKLEQQKQAEKIEQVKVDPEQQFYYPPMTTDAPLMQTARSDELLMPPAEAPQATYTLEQVHTLLNMERERLQKQSNSLE